jgi:hypothetical protein
LKIYSPILLLVIIFTISPVFTTQVPFFKDEITVDGKLSENPWSSAITLYEFFQNYPDTGDYPIQPSEVKIWRNSTAINFGIIFYGPTENLRMVCNVRDGDVYKDDSVEIHLNTFNSDESAYYFEVNPLNTKNDGITIKKGQGYENNWDGVWYSDVVILKDRWIIEISIPYQTIRYSNDDTWKFNIIRNNQVEKEVSCLFAYESYPSQIGKFGKLEGLTNLPGIFSINLIPYGMSKSQYFETHLENKDDIILKGGLDAGLIVGGNFSLISTLNPDYAHIESDPETINLSRDEIQLTEKRPFFLEAKDLFSLPLNMFYSRKITDILIGEKAILNIGDARLGYLYNFLKEDDPNFPENHIHFLKYEQGVGDIYTFKGGYLARESHSDNNRLFFVRNIFRLKNKWTFGNTFGGTFTSHPDSEDEKGFKEYNTLFLNYRTTNTTFEVDFIETNPDINPELGYLVNSLKGVNYLLGITNIRIPINTKGIEKINLNLYPFVSHHKETGKFSYRYSSYHSITFMNNLLFGNQIYYLRDATYYQYDDEIYDIHWYSGEFGYNPSDLLNSKFTFGWGKSYYFSYWEILPEITISPFKGFTIEESIDIVFPEGDEDENVWVSRTKITHSLTDEIFWRFIMDIDSNDTYRFAGMLKFEYLPGSNLYLVYNDTFDRSSGSFIRTDSSIFAKCSYLLEL